MTNKVLIVSFMFLMNKSCFATSSDNSSLVKSVFSNSEKQIDVKREEEKDIVVCPMTNEIEKFIYSIPVGKTPSEKLADVILEQFIWVGLTSQTGFQIMDLLKNQLKNQVSSHGMDKLNDQVSDQVRDQVFDQGVLDQIWSSSVIWQAWDRIDGINNATIYYDKKNQIFDLVRDQIRGREDSFLQNVQLLPEYEKGILNEALKPVIDITFQVYQNRVILMRHSQEMKYIRGVLSTIISKIMSRRQVRKALNRLNTSVPLKHENVHVNRQLLIVRHLLGIF